MTKQGANKAEMLADALMRSARGALLTFEHCGYGAGLTSHEWASMTPGQRFAHRIAGVRTARHELDAAERILRQI